jgi:tetratricopeptide (TPR) repeat protein
VNASNDKVIKGALGVLAMVAGIISIFYFTSVERPPANVASLPKPPAAVIGPEDDVHAGYAGSETCRQCHAGEFEKWKKSNHGMAERSYDATVDNKAFNPTQTLTHGKNTSQAFLDAAGVANFLTLGSNNKRQNFPVVRVIGNNPLRQFLVPAPGGRLQVCDVSLDPSRNEWFDVYGTDERDPGDWGHWTGQGMNWNSMCAACHNTRLRKNYEPQTNSYHTSMAEMSVSCESCHGPMKSHVDWQKNRPPHAKDPTVTKQTRDQMFHTCGACHARRAEVTGDLIPGESFYDHFSLTVTDESDTYHADGQVRDEDYEFASFLSSRMHQAGVRCLDCHDPHTGKRLQPGNLLCMRCHSGTGERPGPVIDPVSHSHHGADSSGNQCTSCHMPVTTYMQRHPRHDHSFSIPDPLLTRELAIPNACNRCHTDKDTNWAIDAYKEFYGEKPDRPSRTRARLIASARRGAPSARDGLIQLLANPESPIWKASACHLLARWVMDPPATQALIRQLAHESPLVREAAVRTLGISVRQNQADARSAIQPLLDDPIRSVRIAAAWALCDKLDLNSLAGRELCHMLDINSDQPTGRMQLAQFAMFRGDIPSAIRQMRKAIEWDPNSPLFHHDLAILLSTTGDSGSAVNELREAVRLDATNADYSYKLGLALNETGALAESITAFENTVKLEPTYARAWYNLGLARNQMNQPRAAIAALRQGESADPTDSGIPYARATIHARLGEKSDAYAAAARALQLRPDFIEARQFMQAISQSK